MIKIAIKIWFVNITDDIFFLLKAADLNAITQGCLVV